MWGGWRATFGGQFSPSAWDLGIEHRLPGLYSKRFYPLSSHQPKKLYVFKRKIINMALITGLHFVKELLQAMNEGYFLLV